MAISWRPYIPSYLTTTLISQPGTVQYFEAVALFVDIAGFTPLSEKMTGYGKAGTEQLGVLLNDYFSPIIALIRAYGGVVSKFAGDGLTALFPAEQPRNAIYCAWQMQKLTADHFQNVETPFGHYRLAIKIGLGVGNLFRLVVGNSANRLEHLLGGPALDDCNQAGLLAAEGEVVCQNLLLQLANLQNISLKPDRATNYSCLAALEELSEAIPTSLESPPAAAEAEDIALVVNLAAFLPAVIAERLEAGQKGFVNEHRRVTTLFTTFAGFDYLQDKAVFGKLQSYFLEVLQTVTDFGGLLAKIDMGDKGNSYMVLFGAPTSHENDAERALRCAVALQTVAANHSLTTSTGVSTGLVFCGLIGSDLRAEYTVIGDAVNLAARLMQIAAPGQILVEETTWQAHRFLAAWQALPPVSVKGKTEPVNVKLLRRLLNFSTKAASADQPAFVGREVELALIEQKITLSLAAQSQIIGICGEAGLGKSRLIAEAIRQVNQKYPTVRIVSGSAQSYATTTPYLVWRNIWQTLFDLPEIDGSVSKIAEQLTAVLQGLNPALLEYLPLAGLVLNLPLPENAKTINLDARLRKIWLESWLASCLRAFAAQSPLLLVLEDCHWLDNSSWDLLERLSRQVVDLPVMFLLSYRSLESSSLQLGHLSGFTEVQLNSFSRAEAIHLINLKLAALSRTPELSVEHQNNLIVYLTERGQGNPFYIEELLNYLHDKKINLADITLLDKLELPSSLHNLVLSRLDVTSEAEKTILKVASVVGRSFKAHWLWEAYPACGGAEDVLSSLDRLARLDIVPLEAAEPEFRYIFKHIITRDVAYESMSYATRGMLHEQVGLYIEQNYAANLVSYIELLAYHFDHSLNLAKKRHYLKLAAEKAQKSFANASALDYYSRLLSLLNSPADFSEKIEMSLQIAEILDMVGRWDEALSNYRENLNLLEAAQLSLSVAAANSYYSIGRLLKRRFQFADALTYLEKAQQIYQHLADHQGMGTVLIEIGDINRISSKLDIADKFFEESLKILRPLNEQASLSYALTLLGLSKLFQKDYTRARNHMEEGLQLRKQLGNLIDYTYSLANCGLVEYEAGDYEAARRYYIAALQNWREIGDKYGLGFTLAYLGDLDYDVKDYSAAQVYFQESVSIWRELNAKPHLVGALTRLARAYFQLKNYTLTREILAEALPLARQVGAAADEFISLRVFVIIALELGNYSEASTWLEQAKQIAETTRDDQDLQIVAALAKQLEQATQ